ncbi:MAG: SDR family oxidoreductase [Planctomycetota bacterium]
MSEVSALSGKTALVTGGAKRIGRAVAVALAAEGANVVIHYRRSGDEAEATADRLCELGADAWTISADLADPAEAAALFDRATDAAGPIDLLVNNAAIFEPGTLTDFNTADLARNVQINALAPLQLARGFADQGREGAIVNFLDTRVVAYDREHVAYHLSKRMLFSLTRMMALEFAPAVRVNAVAPGLILPPPGKDRAYLERMTSSNPLNRVGTLSQVTEAVLFLLANEFVTGQVIFVDGGQHMRGRTYG